MLDGAIDVSFTLYDGDTGGSVLFSEAQSLTLVDGAFVAYIGDITPLDLAIFRDHEAVFLGVRVGDDPEEMKPRIRLGAVPYAAYAEYAGDAETLGGKLPSDFASAMHTHPEMSYTAGAGLSLSAANQFTVDTWIIQQRVTGTCPAGQAMRSVGQGGAVTCEANLQQRVTGTCPANQAMSAINANGTVTCQSAAAWPAGSYCILRGSGVACPAGFSDGSVHFDTEDNNNANTTSGNIGAIAVSNNIDVYLCCK